VVGSGVSSIVYKAAWQGTDVAVKVLRKSATPKVQMTEFEHEVHISQLLGSHPRVVPFCGACADPDNLMIVMTFMKFGSLEDHLLPPPSQTPRDQLPLAIGNHISDTECLYNLKTQVQMLVDVSAGLMFLHSKNVLHCDISARNCLVDNFLRAYVCDFGMSTELAAGTNLYTHPEGKIIPIKWCAPETIVHGFNTRQSDCYMFAMFLCEVMAREAPYQRCAMSSPDEEILSGILNETQPLRPVIPAWCPMEIAAIIQESWQFDPDKRLTMSQINARLGEYLEICFRVKDIKDVYKPFQQPKEMTDSVLSLEEEMTLSAAYQRIKRSHYMGKYEAIKPDDNKKVHVHNAACHPTLFGTAVNRPVSSLIKQESLLTKHDRDELVNHFEQEITQLRADHAASIQQLQADHIASQQRLRDELRAQQGAAFAQLKIELLAELRAK